MALARSTAWRSAAIAAGVASGAALVWYVGPLVAVDGVVPLAGEPARWAAIAVLVAIALVALGWRQWRQARKNRHLMEGLLADREASPGDKEVALITRRFEHAVKLLRRARIGGRRRWLAALRGLPYVYQLPWYVIIGAPGAGKTTALVNSGLEFPLAQEMGLASVRGIGGTRHCDWWFTSSAVLIDTAGRYAMHGSDRAADRKAWFGFLDLLAKNRPRRPLNGVLLTVSASDLLGATLEQRAAHAKELRQRIEELHERLGIAIPVYLLVTKTDLLAGFVEFFADFDKDERAQVWGVTFPYEAAPSATQAPEDHAARLAGEFAALEKRLNDCMLERLMGERDRERRAAIHAFPQQWRLLRQTLLEFLESLGEGMPAPLRSSMRGVYFTSATQEGTPMDRALGGMARALGLAHRVLAPGRPSGKTFFVTRLLREVVFAEAELAGTNLRWRKQRALLEWGLVGVLVCTVVVGATLSWRAYAASEAHLRTLGEKLPALQGSAVAARRADADDLVAVLPLLDALDGFGAAGAASSGARAMPAAFHLGLDRREMLHDAAQDAYRRALRETFLPRIAERLERRLRAGEREHVELIYETLRAYLMLFGGRHVDAGAVRAYLHADWDATLPPQVTHAQRERLQHHLDRLLATGELGAPSRADAALVARSRALVASVPLAQRTYRRLVQTPFGESPDAAPGGLAWGGEGPTRLFVRASGARLQTGVGGLYTRAVAGPALRERTLAVLREFVREEEWVLGRATPALADPAAQGRLVDEVRQLYLADYASRWASFIADLRLAPTASLDATAEQASLLARGDSPLASLLRTLAREVSVEGLAAAPVAGSGTSEISFDALRRYVIEQPSALDEATALIGRVATQLAAVADAARRHSMPAPSDALRELRAAALRAPEPMRRMLAELADTGSAQSLALLREPLGRELASQIGPACNGAIGGRFPLGPNGGGEMSREDFVRVFAAGGLIDGFFQTRLAPYVDSGARPWSMPKMATGARAAADDALQPFQRAQLIREAFFGEGGKRLGARLEFKLLEMDPGLSEFTLDIDGQPMRFRAGARAQTVQWPGEGGQRQVRLAVQPSASAGYVFQGPWALYHLLERVRVERGASPDRAVLQFDVEGHRARFEVRSAGPLNPLLREELERFQCPKSL